MDVGIQTRVAYILITAYLSLLGDWSWNILVIFGNKLIRHTNLLCEWQQGITNIVPGITSHWIVPCKLVFRGEILNARVPMKQLKFRLNVGGVRVEPIMEPLLMNPIMAGSDAPPSQRELRLPHSYLGIIF